MKGKVLIIIAQHLKRPTAYSGTFDFAEYSKPTQRPKVPDFLLMLDSETPN